MKLVLTIIIILSASFANAKTYNRPYIKMLLIEKISGGLFVIFGIVLLTGSLVYLNNFFKM